ncbi:MAG: DUF4153 domain-containing protein [Clostridiaceae bacterium]
MKLESKIKDSITELSKSLKRFPLTAIFSFILLVLAITYNELNMRNDFTQQLSLMRFIKIAGIGILLSVSLKHLAESFFPKKNSLILMIPTLFILLLIYYIFYTKRITMIDDIRFVATLFFSLVCVFFTAKLRDQKHYEVYVIKIFGGAFMTALYSGVLYFGISAIIFTINALFDANIDSKYYFYFFLIVTLIFGVLMLLSKLPLKDETFEGYTYSKGLKVLLLYIVIPLITIYTVILYVYFAKILITQSWPRGIVSNLVLWYAVLCAAVIFFLTPILEEKPISKLFRVWFPRLLIPILAMMFVSIGKRINQYGFTENRYYVVLLGIWILLVMIYFVFTKTLRNIFLPLSLSIFVFISVYGPLSAFNISSMSQNNRLTALLEKNNMIQNGLIIPSPTIPKADKENISSIVYFFENRDISKIKYLEDDFDMANFEKTFGFSATDNYFPSQQYVYLYAQPGNASIDIKGYDYSLTLASDNQSIKINENTTITYDTSKKSIVVNEGGELLLEADITDKLKSLVETYSQDAKGIATYDQTTFIEENSKVKLKFIITELDGYKEDETYVYNMIRILTFVTIKP